jgi:hypothetical protein
MQSYSSEDDNTDSTSVPVGGTAEDANPDMATVVPGRYPVVPARADSTSSASVVPARAADWNPARYSPNGPWMPTMALG